MMQHRVSQEEYERQVAGVKIAALRNGHVCGEYYEPEHGQVCHKANGIPFALYTIPGKPKFYINK
jgi:hypothetical protein